MKNDLDLKSKELHLEIFSSPSYMLYVRSFVWLFWSFTYLETSGKDKICYKYMIFSIVISF